MLVPNVYLLLHYWIKRRHNTEMQGQTLQQESTPPLVALLVPLLPRLFSH